MILKYACALAIARIVWSLRAHLCMSACLYVCMCLSRYNN